MPSSKLQPRSKLAPVLEDYYMGGPHVDYETDAGDFQLQQKQLRATAAAAAAAAGAPKQLLGRCSSKPGCKETGSKKALESISPLRLLGKLRDRYVRMMNDMAEKGDMITVGLAGYHGAVATPYRYPCCSTRPTTMTKDYNLDSSYVWNKILPGIIHWQSPKSFGYYPFNVSTAAGSLGEILSGGVNFTGFSWITFPVVTELEIIVLDWLGKLLHLPEEFLSSGDATYTICILHWIAMSYNSMQYLQISSLFSCSWWGYEVD